MFEWAYIWVEKRVTNLEDLYSGELIHGWGAYLQNFTVIILAILFPICLLNLINMFHHISVLCTVKST